MTLTPKAATEDLVERLQEIVAYHDADVADELAREGERADFWTDVDAPVELLRQAAGELRELREALKIEGEIIDDLLANFREHLTPFSAAALVVARRRARSLGGLPAKWLGLLLAVGFVVGSLFLAVWGAGGLLGIWPGW